MSEPSLELQRSIFQALVSSTDLQTAMGGTVRAYDRVPPTPLFPYITFSDSQLLDDGDTCENDRFEAFVDIHVWSRTVGKAEAKTISGIVRGVLLALPGLAGWNVPIAEFQQARHMDDPDKLSAHSVNTFRFSLEPA